MSRTQRQEMENIQNITFQCVKAETQSTQRQQKNTQRKPKEMQEE